MAKIYFVEKYVSYILPNSILFVKSTSPENDQREILICFDSARGQVVKAQRGHTMKCCHSRSFTTYLAKSIIYDKDQMEK